MRDSLKEAGEAGGVDSVTAARFGRAQRTAA